MILLERDIAILRKYHQGDSKKLLAVDLYEQGMNRSEIARYLSVSPATITKYLTAPENRCIRYGWENTDIGVKILDYANKHGFKRGLALKTINALFHRVDVVKNPPPYTSRELMTIRHIGEDGARLIVECFGERQEEITEERMRVYALEELCLRMYKLLKLVIDLDAKVKDIPLIDEQMKQLNLIK